MFFLFLVGAFLTIYGFTTLLNEKPRIKSPIRPPQGEDEIKAITYSWQLESITETYFFEKKVFINLTNVNEARDFLLNGSPSKILHYSDDECAIVAKKEIFHPKFGIDSEEIEQLVEYIIFQRKSKFLSDFEVVNLVLNFVHEPNIQYMYDKNSTGYDDYFRCPIETLYDQVGDCDCKAILAATILKKLNFEVAFLLLPGHAAIAISSNELIPAQNIFVDGKLWYYCETTGQYWLAGQIPQGINWKNINLFELS